MVYSLTAHFPKSELFGVRSQIRRAAASVPANIAQGFGLRTTREFLQIAAGEMEETRYFLMLSRDLEYINPTDASRAFELCDSVGQLINAPGRSLKKRV
jgi:four helix bundle protein